MYKPSKLISIALVLMLLVSLIPMGVVNAMPGYTQDYLDFIDIIKPKLLDIASNATTSQLASLKNFGDRVENSTLKPGTGSLDSVWNSGSGSLLYGVITPELITKYGSQAEAEKKIAQLMYGFLDLFFFLRNNQTAEQAVDASLSRFYTSSYAIMNDLTDDKFNAAALNNILSENKVVLNNKIHDTNFMSNTAGTLNTSPASDFLAAISGILKNDILNDVFTNPPSGGSTELLKTNLAVYGITPTIFSKIISNTFTLAKEVDIKAGLTGNNIAVAPSVFMSVVVANFVNAYAEIKDTATKVNKNDTFEVTNTDKVYFKLYIKPTANSSAVEFTSFLDIAQTSGLDLGYELVDGVKYLYFKPTSSTNNIYSFFTTRNCNGGSGNDSSLEQYLFKFNVFVNITPPAPENVVNVYKMTSQSVYAQVYSATTLSLADAYVVAQNDGATYFAQHKDGVSTPISGQNTRLSTIVVDEKLANVPNGSVVWVDTDTSNDTIESGEYFVKGTNAFSTIPQAVSAAQKNTVIVVKDGTYSGDIDLSDPSKEGVTIRNGSNPVITGNILVGIAAGTITITGITFVNNTITIDAPNVTLTDLNLDGVKVVTTANADNLAVQGVTVTSQPTDGSPVISIANGASGVVVSGNTFSATIDNGKGIVDNNTTPANQAQITANVLPSYDMAVVNGTNGSTIPAVSGTNVGAATVTNNISDNANTLSEDNVKVQIRLISNDSSGVKVRAYVSDMQGVIDSGKFNVMFAKNNLMVDSVTLLDANYQFAGNGTSNTDPNSNKTAINSVGKLGVDFIANGGATAPSPNGSNEIELCEIVFKPTATATAGDDFQIWLNNVLPSEMLRNVADTNGNVLKKLQFTTDTTKIMGVLPSATLIINLDFEMFKYVGGVSSQNQAYTDMRVILNNTPYNIYNGATYLDPSVVLTSTAAGSGIGKYTLTFNNVLRGTYTLTIEGGGYGTYTNANVDVNSALVEATVYNNTINFTAGDIVTDLNDGGSGDINNGVNLADYSAIASNYNLALTDANVAAKVRFDLNRDKKVDLLDLTAIIANWGK